MEGSPKLSLPHKETQEKKDISSFDLQVSLQSFTPPPSGIDPVPVQQKNIIQQMQDQAEEEKPEYFRPDPIQRLQDLPEEEKPEILQPSLIQRMQKNLKDPEPEKFIPESSVRMPEDVRYKMEQAFNTDFSSVNIHEGGNAGSIHALAYTQGNDIHFAPGKFQPYTQQGQELLGHELTHVLQQREGRVHPTTQKKGVNINDSPELEKEADEMGKKAAQGQTLPFQTKDPEKGDSSFSPIQMKGEEEKEKVTFIFRVYIDSMMSSEQLLLLFIQQYKKVDAETALTLKMEQGWKWIGEPGKVTEQDVQNKYVDIYVRDGSLSPLSETEKTESKKLFEGLSADEKDAINKETDRQFREKTNYKEGQKLNPSNPSDKVQAEYWKTIRAKLVRQKEQLDKLPPVVKEFLREPGHFKPENYEVLSRIADKLNQFDLADFSDYKSKVNAETDDLLELERSIDRYLEEKQKRKKQQEVKEQIATKLYGLEELYKQYRVYKTLQKTGAYSRDMGAALANQYLLGKLRDELELNAKRNGFSGLGEFEKMIRDYEEAFRMETISIGLDALAKYEHVLYEEEKKYKNQAYVESLFQKLTPAKAHYETADSEYWNGIYSGMSTRDHIPDAQLNRQLEHYGNSRDAREKGDAIVRALGDEKSVWNEKEFDKETAAKAQSPAELQSILLNYIQDKRKSISETRSNMTEGNMVFKLENLIAASYQMQGIGKGSVYDMIIQDKIGEIQFTEVVLAIALAVFSIALGLVTFGSGTAVGIAAGATVFGISAWQAYEEYTKYVKMNDASAVGFTEDPSLVWLIIAVAGAGLDAAAVTSSIKALAVPARIFNETGDLAKLEKALAEISEVDIRIKEKVLSAAKAEQQYQEALKDMVRTSSKMYSNPFGDPELFYQLVKASFYAAKKGVIRFEQFLLELRRNKLIKEVNELTPEDLAKIKEAFEQGQKEFKDNPALYDDLIEIEVTAGKTMEEITDSLKSRISAEPQRFELKLTEEELSQAIAHGRSKGLDDKTIEDILFQGSRKEKAADVNEILKQMDNTVTIEAQGYPVIFKSPAEFAKFKSEVVISSLKKFGLPVSDVRLQGSLLRKTTIDEIGDIDIGIVVKKEEFDKWIEDFLKETTKDKKKKALLKAKNSGIITANEMYFPNAESGILGAIYDQYKMVMGVDAPKKIQVSIILQGGKFDLNPYMPF